VRSSAGQIAATYCQDLTYSDLGDVTLDLVDTEALDPGRCGRPDRVENVIIDDIRKCLRLVDHGTEVPQISDVTSGGASTLTDVLFIGRVFPLHQANAGLAVRAARAAVSAIRGHSAALREITPPRAAGDHAKRSTRQHEGETVRSVTTNLITVS